MRTALQQAGIDYDSADPTFLPSMSVALDAEGAKKVFRLIDALEDSDEVQNVYANFDVSDEVHGRGRARTPAGALSRHDGGAPPPLPGGRNGRRR